MAPSLSTNAARPAAVMTLGVGFSALLTLCLMWMDASLPAVAGAGLTAISAGALFSGWKPGAGEDGGPGNGREPFGT